MRHLEFVITVYSSFSVSVLSFSAQPCFFCASYKYMYSCTEIFLESPEDIGVSAIWEQLVNVSNHLCSRSRVSVHEGA